MVTRVDAEAFEHADEGLAGEDRTVQLVAGTVKADDEAVADELVFPDALNVSDILDADLCRCHAREREQEQHAQSGRYSSFKYECECLLCDHEARLGGRG